jgi:hypothetical protein
MIIVVEKDMCFYASRTLILPCQEFVAFAYQSHDQMDSSHLMGTQLPPSVDRGKTHRHDAITKYGNNGPLHLAAQRGCAVWFSPVRRGLS